MKSGPSWPIWVRIPLWAGVGAAVVFLAVGPFHLSYGPYDGRNGVVEALDDAAAGRPLRLYAYHAAQIDDAARIPGLACPPTRTGGLWQVGHVFIDEAATSEGHIPTWIEMRRGEAARSFAYLYNVTMLQARRHRLQQACPTVAALPYAPLPWYR